MMSTFQVSPSMARTNDVSLQDSSSALPPMGTNLACLTAGTEMSMLLAVITRCFPGWVYDMDLCHTCSI